MNLERKARVPALMRAKPGERYTPRTAAEVIGNKFQISGAKGEIKGEGVIVGAECQNGGEVLAVVIELPEHLTPNLTLDAGISMGEPHPIGRRRPFAS